MSVRRETEEENELEFQHTVALLWINSLGIKKIYIYNHISLPTSWQTKEISPALFLLVYKLKDV